MTVARHCIDAEMAASPLPDEAEWHIAGVVVHARPERLDAVRAAAEALSGTEVHAANGQGKLVVTIEGPTTRFVAAHLEFLQKLPDVLSAALVYQHYEDAESMQEEMRDGFLT